MEWLAISDVEQIVQLVSRAGDPTHEMPVIERKRMLVEGVAVLVGADTWVWTIAVFNDTPGDNMATSIIHGGWASEQESAKWFAVLSNPVLRPIADRVYQRCRLRYTTVDREAFAAESAEISFNTIIDGAGIGDFLIPSYPVAENCMSSIGLYRRLGKPDFTNRERAIAHVIFDQVDWLHRHGADVPAKDKVFDLSPRERQVLMFLLGGDTQKVVARKLSLSEHTVGDYIKQIYKRFLVSSRAELLSHFISGGLCKESK